MVSDSSICDEDRVWLGRKVFRRSGALIGFAGYTEEAVQFIEWWSGGMSGPKPNFENSTALVLDASGLTCFIGASCIPERVKSGREAIGTGGKAAMCAYEALGWSDPRRAVSIVCRHDAGSRGPVRVYRLNPGV